jgi:hypothetical protein
MSGNENAAFLRLTLRDDVAIAHDFARLLDKISTVGEFGSLGIPTRTFRSWSVPGFAGQIRMAPTAMVQSATLARIWRFTS